MVREVFARVSNVLVSLFAEQRLKGPLLSTFPCRGACWHVRGSTLHQGIAWVCQGLGPHVPLWTIVSPVVPEGSSQSAKHLQPAQQESSVYGMLQVLVAGASNTCSMRTEFPQYTALGRTRHLSAER